MTSDGADFTTAPSPGLVEVSAACADAGPAPKLSAHSSAASSAPRTDTTRRAGTEVRAPVRGRAVGEVISADY